jgi:hypothetical protein
VHLRCIYVAKLLATYLDSVSIAFARTLLQREKDYIRETEQLHLQAESSKAILIADKFREMKHYDEALTKLDEAHVKGPSGNNRLD